MSGAIPLLPLVCLHPVTMDKFTFFTLFTEASVAIPYEKLQSLSTPPISRMPFVNTVPPLTHVYQHLFFHWSVWTETQYEFLTSP